LGACSDENCLKSYNVSVSELHSGSLTQLTGTDGADLDQFGGSVASAANGKVLVVGRPGYDPAPADADSDAEDDITNTAPAYDAGGAELFFEVNGVWWHGAFLEATTPSFNSQLGASVAADSSGNTVVIGAPGESDDADMNGAAYVFIRVGETWKQSAKLTPGLARAFARFGQSVAMSGDGRLIAIGAPGDTNPTIDPYTPLESSLDAGSVTLYRYDDASGEWQLAEYLRSPLITSGDRFGHDIALSENGSTLMVSAPGAQPAEEGAMSGIVNVFNIEPTGSLNRQQLTEIVEPQQDALQSSMGTTLALSADGNTLLVSCLNRPDNDTNRFNLFSKPQSEVIVYHRTQSAANFEKTDRLTPAGEHGSDTQMSVAVSANGEKIAAGIFNDGLGHSVVSVFKRGSTTADNPTWSIINSFEQPEDGAIGFASDVAFSRNGEKLFVGADRGSDGGTVYIY